MDRARAIGVKELLYNLRYIDGELIRVLCRETDLCNRDYLWQAREVAQKTVKRVEAGIADVAEPSPIPDPAAPPTDPPSVTRFVIEYADGSAEGFAVKRLDDPDPAAPPAGPEADKVLAGVVGYATDRGMLHLYHDRESFRDRLASGDWSQAGWIDGVWLHRSPAPPLPAEPAAPPPAGSDAVRITIEYADSSAEGADGPDAAAIWKHILGLFQFASVHGMDYTGPMLRPIRRAGGTGEDRP